MCGRYRLTRADKVAEKFDAELSELHPRYNIAPTQRVFLVRASGSRRVIASMRWGLIPNWAKDASMICLPTRFDNRNVGVHDHILSSGELLDSRRGAVMVVMSVTDQEDFYVAKVEAELLDVGL